MEIRGCGHYKSMKTALNEMGFKVEKVIKKEKKTVIIVSKFLIKKKDNNQKKISMNI